MAPANSSSTITNGGKTISKAQAIEPSSLPAAQSPELVLVPATPVEHEQCTRLNADEWRGPLTIEQYMQREQYLISQDLTRDGRETPWMLTSTKLSADKNGDRPILASCETILANAYVARAGKLDEVLTHGIGSVFCRAEHRGKGYAGRMMKELGKQLETWQQADGTKGVFSVLYSDIGQKFYSRFGWKVFPSTHIQLPTMTPKDYDTARQSLPDVANLYTGDLKSIPAAEYVMQYLLSLSKREPNTAFVAIKPDAQHFAWHHAREEFVSTALGKQSPKVKGAIDRATGIALIWTRVYAADAKQWQLHVLHTVVPPEVQSTVQGMKSLSALLLRAQAEAHTAGMTAGVEVWDPSNLILAAAQDLRTDKHDKIEVINRDEEHVCSLRWTSPDSDADTVIWAYNQKYAWC